MKALTNEEIGLLRCAQRPEGAGMPAEGERGGNLLEPFIELMFAGLVQHTDDQKSFVLTPEGEDALYAATRDAEAE